MNLPPPPQNTDGSPIVEVGANPNEPIGEPSGGGGLSKAAIVGITVAGVAALIAAALLGVFLLAKANAGPGAALWGQGAQGTSHDNPIHATPYKMFDNPLSA